MLVPGLHSLGDKFLRERLAQIIKDNNITLVVETGLNEGKSTVEFCKMAQSVIGIDIDPACVESARRNLTEAGLENYALHSGNSPDILKAFIFKNALFFLDAHWEGPWPLLEEIRAIKPGNGIIVIHDFEVPGKDFLTSNMLFPDGSEQTLNYEIVKDALMEWSPTHRIEYSTESDPAGGYVGTIFVYPS